MKKEIFERLRDHYSKFDHYSSELKTLGVSISGVEFELEKVQIKLTDLDGTWEALRFILDTYSGESVRMLMELLNKGLNVIFDDRNYRVDHELSTGVRKSIKLFIEETFENGTVIRSVLPKSVGGGIRVVVSFILQVFLIQIYGNRKFMLLDESFTQISSAYIDNFMRFLRYLIEEMGFNFLFITHDQRILPYFDAIYRVNLGTFKRIMQGKL